MKKIIYCSIVFLMLNGINNTYAWDNNTAKELPTTNFNPSIKTQEPLFNELIAKGLKGSHLVNQNYKIAVGDILSIHFWGAYKTQYYVIVSTDGEIYIPELGELMVVSFSLSQLEERLKKETLKWFKDNVKSGASLMSGNSPY